MPNDLGNLLDKSTIALREGPPSLSAYQERSGYVRAIQERSTSTTLKSTEHRTRLYDRSGIPGTSLPKAITNASPMLLMESFRYALNLLFPRLKDRVSFEAYPCRGESVTPIAAQSGS